MKLIKPLFFLLFLLTSLVSSSQVFAHALNLTIGVRDNSYQKFTWGETRNLEKPILISFNEQDIKIYTEEIQYYQTFKPEHFTEEKDASYWNAVDSNMKRCQFYMYNTGDVIMILYDDVCIIYGVLYK
jgi:hypothetical protein